MKNIKGMILVVFVFFGFSLANATTVSINNIEASKGDSVTIPITVDNAQSIAGYQFTLQYDISVLNFKSVANADTTKSWTMMSNTDNPGDIIVAGFSNTLTPLSAGKTNLLKLTFEVVGNANDTSNITFAKSKLTDKDGNVIVADTSNGIFTVKDDNTSSSDINNTNPDNIIYSENFSSNPNFTSLSTTGKASWNESNGYYRVEAKDDLNDKYFAYSPNFGLVDTNRSIFIQFDMLLENQDWGTYPGVRFYTEEPSGGITSKTSFYVINGNADNSREEFDFRTYNKDQTGANFYRTNQRAVDNNIWYQITIQTDGDGKANLKVIRKSDNKEILNKQNVDFKLLPFSYMGVGYYDKADYGNNWSPIRVDNILIKYADIATEKTLQLKQGWNLVGADFNLSNVVEPIDMIWQYKTGQWFAYSPNSIIQDKIQNTQSIGDISTNIESKDGTWLYANQGSSIKLNNPSESTYKYDLGWSLAGSSKDIATNNIQCNSGSLKSIWKFNGGNWLLKADKANGLNLNTFDTIKANEGFWVNCSSNAKTITSVEIIGPSSVDETTATTYTAKANYSDGTSEVIDQPTWSENSQFSEVSSNGSLSTIDVNADTVVTLSVSYDGYTAIKDITIKDTTPKAYDYTGTWTGTHRVYLTQDTSVYCNWNITMIVYADDTSKVSATITSHNNDQGECDSFSNVWGDITNKSDSGFKYKVTDTTSDYLFGPDYFNVTRTNNQIKESIDFTLSGHPAKRETTMSKSN